MCIKFDEPKIHHSKKSRRFIQKKVHQKREKIHQAQKCASTSRQESSLESASKWLKLRKTKKAKIPKNSFNQVMRDIEIEKKNAR